MVKVIPLGLGFGLEVIICTPTLGFGVRFNILEFGL